MKTQTTKRSIAILSAVVLTISSVFAKNTLTLSRVSEGTAVISLENNESVAGIQLTVTSSSNVTLYSVNRDGRSAASNWMVSYNKVNDSTINVVIISTGFDAFGAGNGSIASISYSQKEDDAKASYKISAVKVVIANENAQRLEVSTINAEWKKNQVFASSSVKGFSMLKNYPNPFNPSTTLSYNLTKPSNVRLSVYDITGREVARLVDGQQNEGGHSASWNSADMNGRAVASGTYFASLTVDGQTEVTRMLLTK